MAGMDHMGYCIDEMARTKSLIFHVISLPAENSHEISSFIYYENVHAMCLSFILKTLLRPMIFSIKLIQSGQDGCNFQKINSDYLFCLSKQ